MSYRATVEQHFDLGRELLTFRSLNEAKTQASALIDDEARRREMAEVGRARTLRDHTWTTRAHSLMRVFESIAASKKSAATIAEPKPPQPQKLQTA
jgi:spore maturation protein CgeB